MERRRKDVEGGRDALGDFSSRSGLALEALSDRIIVGQPGFRLWTLGCRRVVGCHNGSQTRSTR